MSTRNALAIVALAALMALRPAPIYSAPGTPRQTPNPPQPASQEQEKDHPAPGMDDMPGMNMEQNADDPAASGAMQAMQPGHHMMNGPHMHMTPLRKATPEDLKRADEIAATLRNSIEQYKDYRVALSAGYRIFMPNLPQEVYHFTNYWNGFLEGFTFDPARPTSLLYEKTKDGYKLVGAMYTAPRTDTLEQLDERVPLGIAQWHVHINLCMPKRSQFATADWKRFGLNGSISTAETCSAAGGRFYPQIFGWMVHVYPFENSREKIFGQ